MKYIRLIVTLPIALIAMAIIEVAEWAINDVNSLNREE